MNTINRNGVVAALQFPATSPLRRDSEVRPIGLKGRVAEASPTVEGTGKTDELREKFTQFVGEAFYGQMLKSMRSTVGKPAYFHGGRAEEAFQSQLDQTMSQELTKSTASKFAEPMFERQFPRLAEQAGASDLEQLGQLPRR
jgi:Rod binding domain-containing protein